MQPLLSLKGVNRNFGALTVADNVDLDLRQGLQLRLEGQQILGQFDRLAHAHHADLAAFWQRVVRTRHADVQPLQCDARISQRRPHRPRGRIALHGLLAHTDPIRERSLEGLAVASGRAAAKAALAEAVVSVP